VSPAPSRASRQSGLRGRGSGCRSTRRRGIPDPTPADFYQRAPGHRPEQPGLVAHHSEVAPSATTHAWSASTCPRSLGQHVDRSPALRQAPSQASPVSELAQQHRARVCHDTRPASGEAPQGAHACLAEQATNLIEGHRDLGRPHSYRGLRTTRRRRVSRPPDRDEGQDAVPARPHVESNPAPERSPSAHFPDRRGDVMLGH
jgi:hypothetical protein